MKKETYEGEHEKEGDRPLGMDLGVLAKAYIGAVSKKLEHLSIDRHFYILTLIKPKGQCSPVTQTALCELLNIDKASLVRILDYLVDKELIVREVNPDDRRSHFVYLTRKGETIVPEIENAIQQTNQEALKGLKSKEVRSFYRFLYTVCDNLKAIPAHVIEFEMKNKQ